MFRCFCLPTTPRPVTATCVPLSQQPKVLVHLLGNDATSGDDFDVHPGEEFLACVALKANTVNFCSLAVRILATESVYLRESLPLQAGRSYLRNNDVVSLSAPAGRICFEQPVETFFPAEHCVQSINDSAPDSDYDVYHLPLTLNMDAPPSLTVKDSTSGTGNFLERIYELQVTLLPSPCRDDERNDETYAATKTFHVRPQLQHPLNVRWTLSEVWEPFAVIHNSMRGYHLGSRRFLGHILLGYVVRSDSAGPLLEYHEENQTFAKIDQHMFQLKQQVIVHVPGRHTIVLDERIVNQIIPKPDNPSSLGAPITCSVLIDLTHQHEHLHESHSSPLFTIKHFTRIRVHTHDKSTSSPVTEWRRIYLQDKAVNVQHAEAAVATQVVMDDPRPIHPTSPTSVQAN